MVKTGFLILSLYLVFGLVQHADAGQLLIVSDLISTSRPATDSNHTITFTINNAVPAGGKIVITPQAGYFNIPAGSDYRDIDFLVAVTPGNYTDRTVGAAANGSADGVSFITGASGSLTIDLSTSSGLGAGNQVKILIGTNASYQAAGDSMIINPSGQDSYFIDIRTEYNSSTIDSARTLIATINPVSITAEKTQGPPTMYNGNPSGDFSHTVTAIEIWLNTNKDGICKYSTDPGIVFASKPYSFSNTGSTLHRTVVSGLTSGSSYTYYVRCAEGGGVNPAPEDLEISFSIKSDPPAGTLPGPVGQPDGAGGAPIVEIIDDDGYPYRPDKATLTLSGLGYPSSRVYVLMDGVKTGEAGVQSDSKFSITLNGLERGVRTFSLYAVDSNGNKSTTTSVTYTIVSNTGSRIANINIPPTVEIPGDISPGASVQFSGFAIPDKTVEILIYDRTNPSATAIKRTALADQSGVWRTEFNLTRGDYRLRARSVLNATNYTAFTQYYIFSAGGSGETSQSPGTGDGADLNGDDKVNLIDFSIMLFNWGSAGAGTAADLNGDNNVNIVDFSILLFNWTG